MADEEIIKFVSGEESQEAENNEESSVKVSDALEGLTNVVIVKHQILRKQAAV